MTDEQKVLQLEISNIVDKMTNGLMHPITGKQMLYESSMKAFNISVVSDMLPHYFNPSKDDTNFCTCGKYLTHDCHKRQL